MSKICIDTNIIIRHLVDADTRLTEILQDGDNPIILLPVLFEVVFVLEKIYKIPRNKIKLELLAIINHVESDISQELLYLVLEKYENHQSLSIIDCYLLMVTKQNNWNLESFDKKLMRTFDQDL